MSTTNGTYSPIDNETNRTWLKENKIHIYFWFLGLLNNAPFVIMLAAAKTISEGGTALVFLANVLPSMAIKLSAPYWFDRVSYRTRLLLASAFMFCSFGIVALFSSSSDDDTDDETQKSNETVGFELVGVAFSSAQGGLGEASLLALAGKCDASETNSKKRCITCFSSGTGVAGVFGFLWKFLWNDWLGLSMKQTLWMATVLAGCYALVCVQCLTHAQEDHGFEERTTNAPDDSATEDVQEETSSTKKSAAYREASQQEDQQQQGTESLVVSPAEIANVEDEWEDEGELQETAVIKHVHDMSQGERFRLVLSLYPYMIPLFLVYTAEYALQAGTWTAIGFPVTSVEARDRFYEYSNWMYQVGVFLSRSSGTIYTAPMSILWLMPMLQIINVVFFSWVAVHHVFYNYWLLIPCFYVGLLGGGVYINGYTRICADLPLEHREFALSSTSVAESFGIVMADVLGLFIQSCIYQANNLEGAVVSCPVSG